MRRSSRTVLVALVAILVAISAILVVVYSGISPFSRGTTTIATPLSSTVSLTRTTMNVSLSQGNASIALLLNVVNNHWNSQIGLLSVGAQGPSTLGSTEYNINANFVIAYALTGVDNSLSHDILETIKLHPSWNHTNCRREAMLGISISPFRNTPPPPYHDPSVSFSEQPIATVDAGSSNESIILDNYCYGPVANQSVIDSSFEDSLFLAFNDWANGNISAAHAMLSLAASFWDGYGFQGHSGMYRTRDLGYYEYAIRAIGFSPSNGPRIATLNSYLYLLQSPDGSFSNQYSSSNLASKNQQNTATDVETILSVLLALNPVITLPDGKTVA